MTLVFVSAKALAQETVTTKLNGKIIANIANLEGIYIINLTTEKATITDEGGYFTIPAKECDTLMFSAVQFKGIRVGLTPKDFQKDLFFVRMEPIMNLLKEVAVRRYDNINAVSLGIISKNQKKYTVAERRLKTANDPELQLGLNTSFSADPLLNLLSGRTAMLKKELEVEKKEFYLKQLHNMFTENHYAKTLKIPSDYIKGFEYYIVENQNLVDSLKSKDKVKTDFIMSELATKYNQMIACETN